MRSAALRVIGTVVAVGFAWLPSRAADDTILQHVNGNVGYTAQFSSPYVAVSGNAPLADGNFAVVGARSQGIVALPDSSLVGIGAESRIQIAAFKRAESGSGSTITIPSAGGTIRFEIRHPSGPRANYTFATPTASIAVRGTIGLLTSGPNGDVVVCLACAAADVSITVAGRVYSLLTGETITITPASVVTITPTTAGTLRVFSDAGLAITINANSPVAPVVAGQRDSEILRDGAAAAAVIGGAAAAATSHSAAPATPTATAQPLPTPTGVLNVQSAPRKLSR